MSNVVQYRGDTWVRSWVIRDSSKNIIDITGATARLHVRPDDSEDLIIKASTDIGCGITITGTEGRIDLWVDFEIMQITPGTYRFDLELKEMSGKVTTIEVGKLTILADVTYG